ncbi:efflux RND transporter periplasmic adaptor subunit [Asticcacaulis sp. BYS171W]|uniref:Efflux RND transporter periplasmic adaptor subunit n=1 Tax=Asticcacaulis aquaticus TaxID=2984212 RepID=A0ABT5HU62_9CAUL|nr:efflux RND transporter periplasmic adaptor subunit [Asticcacaulis aquaticus]MDC7683579.1 efflux RND transporter periplasmic adaptor subunit [Asticcacaulis aquaticus]
MTDTALNSPKPQMDRRVAPRWYKRRPFQIGAALGVVAVIAVAIMTLTPASGTVNVEASSLDIGEVVRAPYQDYVPLRAEAIPLETTYITAETSGRVESIAISDGDPVVQGQALAYLANPSLTLEVSAREADISARLSDNNNQLMALKTAQENREQALADTTYALNKAEQELQKRETLRDRNVINDAAVKPYADEVAYQRRRLASIRSAQAPDAQFYASQRQQVINNGGDLRRNREEVRRGLSALTLSAPAQGRLTAFTLKPGQAVKEGDPIGQVDSEGAYKLRAEVDEFYLSRLSNGLTAQARIHDQPVAVRLSKVFPQVTNGRVVVELEFTGPPPSDLKRGEAVDIRLSLGKTQVATLAPAGAWLNDTGGASVFVLNTKGDTAMRRAVTVGRRNPEQVEILSGLKAGERIVVGGTQNLQKAEHLILKGQNQ